MYAPSEKVALSVQFLFAMIRNLREIEYYSFVHLHSCSRRHSLFQYDKQFFMCDFRGRRDSLVKVVPFLL